MSGAGSYATSMVTHSRFIQSLVFVTVFTASYLYTKIEELSHRPEWFIEKNGVLREAVISTGHDAVYKRSRSSVASEAAPRTGKAMKGIDLTRLFAELCRKLKIREDQHSTALAAFYMGALTAWSGSESLRLEESDQEDPELMRKYILRAAMEVLRQHRRLEADSAEDEQPAPEDLEPDQITGTEVAVINKKSKKQNIILTSNGNVPEFSERVQQLACGYYTLSNQTAVLRVDHIDGTRTYTIFYLMIKKEYYFTEEDHLARYLTSFHKQVITSPIPFSELFRSLFGNTRLVNDYEEALEFMRFDPSNPPSREDLKKRYKEMALEMHPDKNPDNLEAHENFQKLQQAKLTIEDNLPE